MHFYNGLRACLCAVVAVVLLPAHAVAGVNDTWDWTNDPATGKPKRRLTIVFDPGVTAFKDQTGIDLKAVVQEAADNWNALKAETGWEFVVDKTGTTGDVVIKAGDSSALDGGATATRTFQGPASGGVVKGATINFDPTPQGKQRDASGRVLRDQTTGKPLAEDLTWGTTGADKLDPISVAKHELTHLMRKKHGKDEVGKEPKDTGNLTDPVSKGNHQRAPSLADEANLKASNTAPVKTATQSVTPGQDGNISVPSTETAGATLFVPGGALVSPTTLSVTPLEGLPLPLPVSLVPEIASIALGLEIVTDPQVEFLEPLVATLFYDDAIWTNPHFGPIDETTLQAFHFNPLSAAWEQISRLAFDPIANSITFPVSDAAFTFYGVGGRELFVPEPGTGLLLGTGVAGLLAWGWRRRGDTRSAKTE